MSDLTRDIILTMEAGPELDALVAERVMGWEKYNPEDAPACWQQKNTGDWIMHFIKESLSWSPSTDVAADYEVLVFVRENFSPEQQKTMAFTLSLKWCKHIPLSSLDLMMLTY
ncbi:MAG: hypothetical protein IID31_09015, partial [Planctomycetes bacterium]|nr:hypothetical protein [Planctomycetota bacterium]